MELFNNKPIDFKGGVYAFQVDITSGTVSIELSIDNQPFKQIPDVSYTSDNAGTLTLPVDCKLKAVISATAQVNISRTSP